LVFDRFGRAGDWVQDHDAFDRHSCGYYLADKGTDLRTMQDYLGHRDPKHTAHYTKVAGHRFEGLWQ
jgi:type 1 fimbriae regulatory protein FimB